MAEFDKKSYYAIIPANVRYDKDLSPNAKLLYGEITALCNEKGYCWAENKYFSELYGVSKKSISKWISSLSEKGYISTKLTYKSGGKEIDKRYITIVHEPMAEDKSSIGMEEKFHTYGRNVQEPMEEKFTDNNTVNITSNNTINNISVEFETLWKMYPRKVGKEAALRAYKKARSDKKDPTTFEQVKQGIENYIRQIEAKHTDTQYIKHGSSWFNARAWKDDYDFSPAKQFSSSPQLVTVNGKEYELRNGKYYTPGGCGIAVDPYAKSDLDDLF